LPRVTVHQEQRIHAGHHGHRGAILWIYFHRIDKLAPRVRLILSTR
jgi:hypothetical protein